MSKQKRCKDVIKAPWWALGPIRRGTNGYQRNDHEEDYIPAGAASLGEAVDRR